MSLVYTFSFDNRYAGQQVHIYDGAQQEVDGSPFTLNAAGDYSLSADEGRYTGKVSNPAVFAGDGYSVADGVLDVPASIANQPGASETAYLVATAVAGDTGDGEATIALEADPAHGDLPDWVTIVSGEAVLGAAAGGCFASLIGRVAYDFTGTDAPNNPGHITGVFALKQDGSQLDSDVVDQAGDGQDAQSVEMATPVGAFILGGAVSATVVASAFTTAGEGDPVAPDAVTAITLAVNITRVAPAPTLP